MCVFSTPNHGDMRDMTEKRNTKQHLCKGKWHPWAAMKSMWAIMSYLSLFLSLPSPLLRSYARFFVFWVFLTHRLSVQQFHCIRSIGRQGFLRLADMEGSFARLPLTSTETTNISTLLFFSFSSLISYSHFSLSSSPLRAREKRYLCFFLPVHGIAFLLPPLPQNLNRPTPSFTLLSLPLFLLAVPYKPWFNRVQLSPPPCQRSADASLFPLVPLVNFINIIRLLLFTHLFRSFHRSLHPLTFCRFVILFVL